MLYIHGLGHFHPENVLDNAFLESLDIGTTDEWIVSRVGIENRRTVLPLDYIRDTKNSDLRAVREAQLYTVAETGAHAARMAIERAGIAIADVGMVIGGTSAPDNCIPAEGQAIAKELGLEVPAFDLQSACSTFGLHMHMVDGMGESAPDYVLSVVPENITRVTDYSDRSTAVLFGDAAVAAVISTKHPARAKISSTTFGTSPAGCMDVLIKRNGYFTQQGSRVQKFAIKKMTELYRERRAQVGDELIYLGHQANLTMLRSVAKRCEVTTERHWFNIDQFGNQAAAGAPAVLSQRWDDVADGERIAMVVVGSGLSWSSLQIDF